MRISYFAEKRKQYAAELDTADTSSQHLIDVAQETCPKPVATKPVSHHPTRSIKHKPSSEGLVEREWIDLIPLSQVKITSEPKIKEKVYH